MFGSYVFSGAVARMWYSNPTPRDQRLHNELLLARLCVLIGLEFNPSFEELGILAASQMNN